MVMPYVADAIRKIDPSANVRHVFGYMLLENSTFSNMTARKMNSEIRLCIACVKEGGEEDAEKNAKSFGL